MPPQPGTFDSSGRPTTVEERIKELILVRRLAPGDPLPTETELCELLGVGRSRIREAIKTLSALDIVEVRHGYGTYVGRLTLTAMVNALAFRATLSAAEDRHMLAELIDVRHLLEASLAGELLRRLDLEQIRRLRALVARMHEHADRGEQFDDDDRAFHLTLMRASGNGLAEQLTGAFWDVQAIAAESLDTDIPLRETADAHAAILDAIEAGSPDGLHAALAAHYVPIRERMARSVDASDGRGARRPASTGVPRR